MPAHITKIAALASLLCCWCLSAPAQSSYYLEIDNVAMNSASETVDIYLHAYDDQGKEFVNFGKEGHELVVTETLLPGGEAQAFAEKPRYWAIRDSLLFGDKTMIQVLTQSEENTHKETRRYEVVWKYQGREVANATYEKRWPAKGLNLRREYSFWDLLTLGIFLATLTLLLLSELVPWLRTRRFHRKYVKPYAFIKDDGVQDSNPITGRPLRPEELVVKYCDRSYCRVPLDVWKKRGYQCMHYSTQQCDGNPQLGNRQFFKQQPFFRQLNWLWFGLMGGVLGWAIVYRLEELLGDTWPLWQNVVLGVGLGLGLGLMLSWVEERGQSRDISALRIALRTVVAALVAGIIFGFGYYLEQWIGVNWVAGPLVWLLFSTALGGVLSVRSSIELRRGLMSGLIAGAIAAVLYGLFLILVDEAQLARLLAFSILGAIMGYGIIHVVDRLQEMKLEVLGPPERSGIIIDLDKWLQAGEKVVIGNHMKNKVRVKWEDEFAQPRHAQMSMDNHVVRIQPISDAELWIDDVPIKAGNSYVLRGGEKICLARNSRTVLRYLQKTKEE